MRDILPFVGPHRYTWRVGRADQAAGRCERHEPWLGPRPPGLPLGRSGPFARRQRRDRRRGIGLEAQLHRLFALGIAVRGVVGMLLPGLALAIVHAFPHRFGLPQLARLLRLDVRRRDRAQCRRNDEPRAAKSAHAEEAMPARRADKPCRLVRPAPNQGVIGLILRGIRVLPSCNRTTRDGSLAWTDECRSKEEPMAALIVRGNPQLRRIDRAIAEFKARPAAEQMRKRILLTALYAERAEIAAPGSLSTIRSRG